MSISFHPDDNDKLTYEEADKIARELAYKFFWNKGYETMWAVHTNMEHIHVHFIVSNCNLKDGKSFRRGDAGIEGNVIVFRGTVQGTGTDTFGQGYIL